MKRSFERYRTVGHRFVTGFLEPEVLLALGVLDSVQRAERVAGAVAEIGVHHGKLFLGLHLLQRPGESSVAIDIFGDQELNIDSSGKGDLAKFLANVELWASRDGLGLHQGDSTKLASSTLRELAGSGIRFFSVDGGHTEEIVLSDLRLAEASLSQGGVVIADDVFNQHWPGVSVGALRYLEEGGKLAPFAIGFNKVFLSQPEYCQRYRAALVSDFDSRVRVATAFSVFAGHEVCLLLPQRPVDLLRKSATARALYQGTYRGMVRAMQVVSNRG
jgi:hypothetical protein